MTVIRSIGFLFLLTLLVVACTGTSPKNDDQAGEKVEDTVEVEIDVRSMLTRDVSTLISDSGVTQYRITTPQWEVYDNSKTPRWYFPEGLHVEKFDSVYATDASILADTGYFFTNTKLWRLVDNVKIVNQAGDKFDTDELFWDQRNKKIYSDKFIHIEREETIIEGYGFESNEEMTKYTIRTPSGIFPIKDAAKQPDTTSLEVEVDTLNMIQN